MTFQGEQRKFLKVLLNFESFYFILSYIKQSNELKIQWN